MAGKKFEKGSEEWKMFTEFWQLSQKYWEPDETESYWNEMLEDTKRFMEHYKIPFARRLCVALHNGMADKLKEKNG